MANTFSTVIKNIDTILEGYHFTEMYPERYSSTPTKSFATKAEATTYAQSLVSKFTDYKTKLQTQADVINKKLQTLLDKKNSANTDTTKKWNMVKLYAGVCTASYSDFIYNSAGVVRHLANTNRLNDIVYWGTDKNVDNGLWKGIVWWISPSWGTPWTQYTQLLISNSEKTSAQAAITSGVEPGTTTTTVTTTTQTSSGSTSQSSTTTTTTDWYLTPWDTNNYTWSSKGVLDRGWQWYTDSSKGPNYAMLQQVNYNDTMMNSMAPLTTMMNKWVAYYKNICQIATLRGANAIIKQFKEVIIPSVPKKYYDTTSWDREYDLDLDTQYLDHATNNSETYYSGQETCAKFMADFKYNQMPKATQASITDTTTEDASWICYSWYNFNNNTTMYSTPALLAKQQSASSNTATPADDSYLKSANIDTLAELLERYDGLSAYTAVTPDSLVTYEQYFYDTLNAAKAGWKAKTGMTLSPYCLGTYKSDGTANTTGVAAKPDGSANNSTSGGVNMSSDNLAKNNTRRNSRWTGQTSTPTSYVSSSSEAESAIYAANLQSAQYTYVNIPDPDYVQTAASSGSPCLVTYGKNTTTNQVFKIQTANSNSGVYGASSIVIYKRWHQTEWYLVGPNTAPSNAGNQSYQYARMFRQNKADFSSYYRLISRLYNDAQTILTWALSKYDTDGTVAKFIKENDCDIIDEPWGMTYVFNDYYNWSDDTWTDNFLQYSCRFNKDLCIFKSDILSGSIKPGINEY
jgi:hypothetical protein